MKDNIDKIFEIIGIEINKDELAQALKTMAGNKGSSLAWFIASDGEDLVSEGSLADVLELADIEKDQIEKAKGICLAQGIVWIFPSYYNSRSEFVEAFVEGDPVRASKRSDKTLSNFLTVRVVKKRSVEILF